MPPEAAPLSSPEEPPDVAWARAGLDAVFLPNEATPGWGRLALYAVADRDADDLAASAKRLGFDAPVDRCGLARPGDGGAAVVPTDIVSVPLRDALSRLLEVGVDDRPAFLRPPDSVRAWALAARVAVRLVTAHRIAPTLVYGHDGAVHGVWRVLEPGDAETQAVVGWLADAMPHAAHALAVDGQRVWTPEGLLSAFFNGVADLAARAGGEAPSSERPRERILPWTARWVEALADPHDPTVPLREDADELVAGLAGWDSAAGDEISGVPELTLTAPDSQDGDWLLDLGLRDPRGAYRPAAEVWQEGHPGEQQALLAGLGRCARLFAPLDRALADAAPRHALLDLSEAWTLIREAGPALREAGVHVALPEELAEGELRARLRVDAPGLGTEEVGADENLLDEDRTGLARAEWEIALGDTTLTSEEFEEILAAGAPLVRWRDRWVRVDPEEVHRLGQLGQGGELGLAEALATALSGSTGEGGPGGGLAEIVPEDLGDTEVVAEGSLADLLDRIRQTAQQPGEADEVPGFVGELRGYQRRGAAWLTAMGQLGLGAVLADDMGLGKTVQLIAHLLQRNPDGPHLVVCPTSVVGNWERELERFAPGITVTRHHGGERPADLAGTEGVVVTSYGTLRRDVDMVAAIGWDVLTLDEAQHVKNPATTGARAVRRLPRGQAVALTGTPLENRLGELWALMDMTNPGLLGSRASFGRRFVTPIETHRDATASRRLRRLVAPFIMRREKSAPEVAVDLPDKIERTVVCSLTSEQAELYQHVVNRVLGGEALAGASNMERRGQILALLTGLKQVCNHPAQYGKEEAGAGGNDGLVGRSGKLAAAREIIGQVVSGDEQAVVFTQYTQMGWLLVRQFAADLGTDVPFIHGGVPAATRDRIAAGFQRAVEGQAQEAPGPPVLVVSLRAGGTGLNLTAATHVIHYDRWWNPAVEDQATDRTHRIGQERAVQVHKLVTAGTVEERISELLEHKRELTESIVGAGEAWVTELSDTEIAELVALSDEASIDDLDDERAGGPAGRDGERAGAGADQRTQGAT